MIGLQVAKITESRNPKYPVGSHIVGNFGWQSHTIVSPDVPDVFHPCYLLPSFGNLSISLGIGTLGMPGNTAYFGLLEICQPRAGETVVVSGAAGAVGSIVGQIAKLKGCRVVGFAGSDEKCRWLEAELGFDKAINYKSGDMKAALKEAAPDGVDCYFDNVGGELSSNVTYQMNQFGRIAVCGSIASYNVGVRNYPKVSILQPNFVSKELKMEGFTFNRWRHRWMEGIAQLHKWMQDERIKHYETVTEGFENMPTALIVMLRGGNIGKAVVRAGVKGKL